MAAANEKGAIASELQRGLALAEQLRAEAAVWHVAARDQHAAARREQPLDTFEVGVQTDLLLGDEVGGSDTSSDDGEDSTPFSARVDMEETLTLPAIKPPRAIRLRGA